MEDKRQKPISTIARKPAIPYLGAAPGLRRIHHEEILRDRPAVPWFEVLTENYLNRGGIVRRELMEIAERYPVVSHGIAMSVGGTDPLNTDHLKQVRQLNDDIGARWTSEHLSFNNVEHTNLPGLIPLPFTAEAVRNTAERTRRIKDALELPLLLENVTYYLKVSDREMNESEFLNAVLEEADVGLLLDVNNVYINAVNHGYDPVAFIRSLPPERIGQIHLAGHDNSGRGPIKDTHDSQVTPDVWELFRITIEHAGLVSTLIERDANIPPLSEMLAEVNQAQNILDVQAGVRHAA
jgi:uncharacterized protein (UPF0276 family)